MSTDTSALTQAVREAAEKEGHRGLGMLPDAVQLNLLRREGDGKIDTDGIRRIRGRGRPPNSRNKRTQKIAQLIVHKFGDPLDGLGNLSTMPLEDAVAMVRHADDPDQSAELERLEKIVEAISPALDKKTAEQLGRRLMRFLGRKQISALDVLQLQVRVGQDLMTYVHGRQPISVNVAEKTDAVVIIPGINAPTDVSQEQLRDAINQRGLDALDFEAMKLIPAPEDGEFSEAGGESDADADG